MNISLPHDKSPALRLFEFFRWLPEADGLSRHMRFGLMLCVLALIGLPVVPAVATSGQGSEDTRVILIVKKAEVMLNENEMLYESQASGQERTVSGKVFSLSDGVALPGVSVFVKGTQTGTLTDVAGSYRINVPSESSILVFSFIGYKTTELAVEGRSTLDIRLETDITQLEEVVVTSFGIEQENNHWVTRPKKLPVMISHRCTNPILFRHFRDRWPVFR